jgi:hypothetical protein
LVPDQIAARVGVPVAIESTGPAWSFSNLASANASGGVPEEHSTDGRGLLGGATPFDVAPEEAEAGAWPRGPTAGVSEGTTLDAAELGIAPGPAQPSAAKAIPSSSRR